MKLSEGGTQVGSFPERGDHFYISLNSAQSIKKFTGPCDQNVPHFFLKNELTVAGKSVSSISSQLIETVAFVCTNLLSRTVNAFIKWLDKRMYFFLRLLACVKLNVSYNCRLKNRK